MKITQISPTRRFRRLLICLLAYLFFTPFIPQDFNGASLVIQGMLSITLLYAALAVQKSQNQRTIALFLMFISLTFHWLGVFKLVPYSANAALLLFIIFYALLIYEFGKQLSVAKRIDGAIIMSSLCLYLVIGLMWGSAYSLLQNINGSAFSGKLLEAPGTSNLHIFNYFSIVTQTTLGYGDITPQTPRAAALCQMQAIIGQFYTAVLVAWLVSTYEKPKSSKKSEDS